MKNSFSSTRFGAKISFPFIVNAIFAFLFICPALVLVFGASGLKFKVALSAALPLAVTASLSVSALISLLTRDKAVFFKRDKRMLNLYACADDELLRIFTEYFDKMHIRTSVTDMHITTDGEEWAILMLPEEVRANELALALRARTDKGKKFVAVSPFFSPAAEKYARERDITIIAEKEILSLLGEKGLLPEPEKKNFLKRLADMFNPSIGKKAVVYGLFIAASSFFIKLNVYYLIWGTLFFLYGAAAVIKGIVEKRKGKARVES